MREIRPELAKRIVWEAAAVEAKFPGRFTLRTSAEGNPIWEGSVPVEGREFPITVVYPIGYPGVPPSLITSLELPLNCPHLLARTDGGATLCWLAPGIGRQRARWDPQRHTAATAMRAAQRWGLAFMVWQVLGRWPVPDAWDWFEQRGAAALRSCS